MRSLEAQKVLIAKARNANEDMSSDEVKVSYSIEFCHVHMRYGKPNCKDTAAYLAIINAPTDAQAWEKYSSLSTKAKEYLLHYIENN